MQGAAAQSVPAASGPDMGRIYREHSRLVFSAAYRVTGSVQDSEDVLQTVFMRLVRREGGSGLGEDPRAYLHRAAVNAGLDVVRSRRTAKATPLDDVEAQLARPSTESQDLAFDAAETHAAVRRAVSTLSPRAAEIFALRHFEGFENHEIARMVGTTRGSIAVMLHRARQRVRDAVRNELEEGS